MVLLFIVIVILVVVVIIVYNNCSSRITIIISNSSSSSSSSSGGGGGVGVDVCVCVCGLFNYSVIYVFALHHHICSFFHYDHHTDGLIHVFFFNFSRQKKKNLNSLLKYIYII